MKINIMSMGNKMPAWIKAGFEGYAKRMPDLKLIEVPPLKPMKIPAKDYIVALDEKGKMQSTQAFAKSLEKIQLTGKDLTFLIGGADGLTPEQREKADETWSLSDLTFPHMLVRVILVEQLYRAFSLLKNHPYHRE